jgi:hypothetical protein
MTVIDMLAAPWLLFLLAIAVATTVFYIAERKALREKAREANAPCRNPKDDGLAKLQRKLNEWRRELDPLGLSQEELEDRLVDMFLQDALQETEKSRR